MKLPYGKNNARELEPSNQEISLDAIRHDDNPLSIELTRDPEEKKKASNRNKEIVAVKNRKNPNLCGSLEFRYVEAGVGILALRGILAHDRGGGEGQR
jgi:hypothetical protein